MSRALKIIGHVVAVLVLWSVVFGAAILGIPTVYGWWKQIECRLGGVDSYACVELDLLRYPRGRSRGGFKDSVIGLLTHSR
jgi:hypothetical protein